MGKKKEIKTEEIKTEETRVEEVTPEIESLNMYGFYNWYYVCSECHAKINWKDEFCSVCKGRINWQ